MAGFEPGSSDIGRDRSANCATTTALEFCLMGVKFDLFFFLSVK